MMENVHELNNVYVTGDHGIILSDTLEYIPLPVSLNKLRSYGRPLEQTQTCITNTIHKLQETNYTLNVVNEPCCYMRSNYNIYPFGHLYDTLQYMYDYEHAGLNKVSWLTGRITSHIKHLKEHFKIFGGSDYITTEPGEIYYIKKLYVSAHETFPSQFDPKKIGWIKNKYIKYYNQYITPQHEQRLDNIYKNYKNSNNSNRLILYLHRDNVTRGVTNITKVMKYLQDVNALIISGKTLSDMSLPMTIGLFNQADILIGPHGSMFRNAMYVNNPRDLICHEWCPVNRKDVTIINAMKSCGVDNYTQTLVPGDDQFNITIPIHQIKEIIND